jgi:cobalamin biosynthesis protein CbiD
MGLSLKVAAGLGLAFIVLAGIFYWYYTSSQARIEVLIMNSAKLELAVGLQQQTIEKQNEFIALQNAENARLQAGISDAEGEQDRFTQILESHDIESIKDQPKLIEENANSIIWQLHRNIENETLKWYEDGRAIRNPSN